LQIALKIFLGLVSLICFAGGMNLLLKGAASFLPKDIAPQKIIDNLFRFLSGIYFSLGFLVAWVVFHIDRDPVLIFLIGVVVVFSGLGRLYSRMQVGSAGKYFDNIMIVEIILGIAIIALRYANGYYEL